MAEEIQIDLFVDEIDDHPTVGRAALEETDVLNPRLTPEERGHRIRPLLRESERLATGPFRLSEEEIEASRGRFSLMRRLYAAGKVEEARRVWWWPPSKDPPRKHYFEAAGPCSCRPRSAGFRGSDGLCRHCGGHV